MSVKIIAQCCTSPLAIWRSLSSFKIISIWTSKTNSFNCSNYNNRWPRTANWTAITALLISFSHSSNNTHNNPKWSCNNNLFHYPRHQISRLCLPRKNNNNFHTLIRRRLNSQTRLSRTKNSKDKNSYSLTLNYRANPNYRARVNPNPNPNHRTRVNPNPNPRSNNPSSLTIKVCFL